MLKIVFFIFALMLQSCGSVSSIRPVVKNRTIDINSYKTVVINDFINATPYKKVTEIAEKTFPENILNNLEDSNLFESVYRNKTIYDSLIISGKIVEYEEGNAILRALVGFGAGRSYFSSDIDLIDGNSNEKIGTIEVRRKSWLLGGYLSSNQTAQSLMEDSASDIVKKVRDSVRK
jgi:hypothetical protein